VDQDKRSGAFQRPFDLGVAGDHTAGFIGEGQILQCGAPQQLRNKVGQIGADHYLLLETSRQNLPADGACNGLVAGCDPDTAPRKLPLDIGHDPAFGVENETQKLVFPAGRA
jgi:hypothetical protein